MEGDTERGPDAWKKSVRNRDGIVELLATLVEKGADSDSAWGIHPDFMHEHMINSRLGVLYRAANLTGGAKAWDWVKRFATA